MFGRYTIGALILSSGGIEAFSSPKNTVKTPTQLNVIGQQAESFGPATAIRKLKANLPQIEWLSEGKGSDDNKVNMPDHVKQILAQPNAPRREAESEERTNRIRSRFEEASSDAAALKGMSVGEKDAQAWWRSRSS